nr:PREDICTED: ammonium transporter Rh type B-like [Apteryx mantelli mantelli]
MAVEVNEFLDVDDGVSGSNISYPGGPFAPLACLRREATAQSRCHLHRHVETNSLAPGASGCPRLASPHRFTSSDDGVSGSNISYPAFQDVSHMVIFGLGFFLAFLKRYKFSSTGFNLLLIVLGVQWSVLMEGLLFFLFQNEKEDDLKSITKATVSMTTVVISSAAVLGKANPIQLIVMTIVEIAAFHLSRWINKMYLKGKMAEGVLGRSAPG